MRSYYLGGRGGVVPGLRPVAGRVPPVSDPTDATVPDPVAPTHAAPPSEPSQVPAPAAAGEPEVHLDVRSFLPEGVELGDPDEAEVEADGVPVDQVPAQPVAAAAEIDVAALEQIERDLDAVDGAIAALDAGTYGIDPATGRPIDDVLLQADPTFLG